MLADDCKEFVYQIPTLPYDYRRESVTFHQRKSIHVVTEFRRVENTNRSTASGYRVRVQHPRELPRYRRFHHINYRPNLVPEHIQSLLL